MITQFVVIESPYAPHADTAEKNAVELARNLAYVRAAMHDCFDRGEIPFASHALYTQPGVLDDTIPEDRKKGIEAGFKLCEFLKRVEARDPWFIKVTRQFYTDRGWSSGMKLASQIESTPYCIRNLGPEWKVENDKDWYLDVKGQPVRKN